MAHRSQQTVFMTRAALLTLRATRRKKSLGAAMIEGAVVMLMMVTTWGAMATAYSNGTAKLSAQWQARSATMYFASNECKKGIPGGGSAGKSANGAIDQTSGNSEGDRARSGAPLGDQSTRQTMFMASGSGTGNGSMGRWSASKTSSSWAICNEGKYDGNLLGLLSYGADFFHDLLPGPIQSIF